jgi:hypothetical protein
MALAVIKFPRAEFAAWVIEKGYNRPSFWGEFPVDAEIVSGASGLKPTASKAAPSGAPRKRCPEATVRETIATGTQVVVT